MPERNQLIWERLVDAESGATTCRWRAAPSCAAGQVSIPRPAGAAWDVSSRPAGSVTRFLSGSSLGSLVTEYDFTASVDLNTQKLQQQQQAEAAGRQRSAPTSVQLPVDDLNEHECMPCVTALVGHLSERVWPLPEVGSPAQPAP